MNPAQDQKAEFKDTDGDRSRELSRLEQGTGGGVSENFGDAELTTDPGDDHTYRLYPGLKEGASRVTSIEQVHEAIERAKLVSEATGSPLVANVRTNLPQLKQELAELDGRAFRITHVVNTDRPSADISSTVQRIWKVAREAQEQGRPEVTIRVIGERQAIVDRVLGYLDEMNKQLREKAGGDRNYIAALREGDPLPARERARKSEEPLAREKKSEVFELSSRGDLKSALNELRDRLKARHERIVESAVQSIFNDAEEGAPAPAACDHSPIQVRVKDLKAARALAKLKPLLVKEFAIDEAAFDKEVLKVTYTKQVVAEREAERAAKAQREKSEAPASGWGIGRLFAKLKWW